MKSKYAEKERKGWVSCASAMIWSVSVCVWLREDGNDREVECCKFRESLTWNIWFLCTLVLCPYTLKGYLKTFKTTLIVAWDILSLVEYQFLGLVFLDLFQNPPAMRETWVWSLVWEDPLEEGMATHSSILACRIPMDRGVWQAAVKSQTWLSDKHNTQICFSLVSRKKHSLSLGAVFSMSTLFFFKSSFLLLFLRILFHKQTFLKLASYFGVVLLIEL